MGIVGRAAAVADLVKENSQLVWAHHRVYRACFVDFSAFKSYNGGLSWRDQLRPSMTPIETLILASYFFVLLILAVYGWHRYYMVYLYMKHKDEQPVPIRAFDAAAGRHGSAPDLQRDVRGGPADRRGLPARLPARPARNPGPRRLDRRDAEIAEPAVRRHAAQGVDIKYLHRTDRTGYKAGALDEGLKVARGRVRRHLRRRLHAEARLPDADGPLLHRSQGGDGAGALGAHQPGLLAADQDPEHPARRALRARARLRGTGAAASSISTARPACGAARRLPTAAAGSTTR